MKNGFGNMSWADGRKYAGEFKNDRKDGWGTFTWRDGRRYTGGWLNGK